MANYCFLLIVAVLVTIKTADSLWCWECASEEGESCADYFNETKIRRGYQYDTRNPKEKNCDESTPQFYIGQQKAVCLKKVQTIYGRRQYTRQCAFIRPDEPVGECPKETTTSQITTDFCQYCDRQNCNGAEVPYTNMVWICLVPIATLLVMRK